MAITSGAPTRRASFVIYKDEPDAPSAKRKTSPTPLGTRTNTRVVVVTAGDKENLHPLTGRRPNTEENTGKKRKTANVLATKLLVASGKLLVDPALPKKRRLGAPASAAEAGEKTEKEKKRAPPRKSQSQRPARVRKATELPKLEEVVEEGEEKECAEEEKIAKITQAAVDARCYELTVLPLADLSKAYEQSHSAKSFVDVDSPNSKVGFRLYMLPPALIVRCASQCNTIPDALQREPSSSDTEPEETPASPTLSRKGFTTFSTPERKRIYSAFTFESPSPASRRFSSWRDSSVERFGEIAFNPIPHLSQ